MNYNINEINYEAQGREIKVSANSDVHFYTDGSGRYGAPSGCAVKILGWDAMLSDDGYASELNVNFEPKTFTTKDAVICTDKGFLKALKIHLVDDCNIPNKVINDLDYAEIDRQITGRVVFNVPGDLDTWFRQQLMDKLINPEVITHSQKF
jgi:hypothetical protein